ncbi:hypothetical protein VTN96DRAFT_2709 [Rasamsonia emersonii]|uniref:Uncharacterized protein n=1 Tax=Rasamsonia emersonii (strain ATCC 16479 / CBS 393.64 / IMI 116815) TaxID=1408163 RepID=A0A0F4Z037_RASE3|nr:hypothetical protein T310_2076 [Rasamsonia emersonii CBS 393.64]KKA23892.1 hypothetical protein T310_2076 [Rasamsonia emersonii CBS 393.64]
MPSASIEEPQVNPRIAELRRPQPRSAGASNRPTRSQNVSELVRFFQTQEDSSRAADKLDGAMDLVKAGRRLLSQARADKRAKGTASPTPSEKPSRGYRKLVALQQASFLPPRASTESVDLSRPSRTKRDVEAMGRPWLDDSVGTKTSSNNSSSNQEQQETRQRCESLSLGDLAALVEFSVSFPDFENEIGPPPYQVHQSQTGLQSSVPADGDQQGQDNDDDQRRLHSPIPTAADSARARGGEAPKGARPALKSPGRPPQERSGPPVTLQSNTVDTKPSDDSSVVDSDGDDAKSLAVLQRATERLEREKKGAEQPSSHNDNVETKETPTHSLNKGVTDTPLVVEPVQSAAPSTDAGGSRNDQPRISGIRRDITPLTLAGNRNGGPIPLTLVAECLPPRVSSRSACRQPQASPQSTLDSASQPPRSLQTPTLDSFPRPQQTLLSPFPIQSRRARSVTPDGAPGQTAVRPKKRKKKQQPPPYYYGVADVAPPPAPTKPLPSLPQSNTSRDQESSSRRSTGDTESAMSSSSEHAGMTVPEKSTQQHMDSPTLGSTGRLKIRKHLTPRPSSSRSTSKSVDMSETMPSSREDRHIKSTSSAESSLEQALRDRAERVHALRMRDMSVSKERRRSGSPTRSLRNGTSSRKDDEDTGARPAEADAADRKIKRNEKHRVSDAPSIPLPMDPPVTAQGAPSTTRRRRSGSSSSLPWSVAALRGYEGDAVSRSNSVRSTSVTDSSIHSGGNTHATTNGNTNGYHHRRSESSSLPSSDEEGVSRRRRSSPSHANEEQNRERRRSGDDRPRSQKQQEQQPPHAPEAGRNHSSEAQQNPRAGDHVASHVPRGRDSSSQEHSSPKSQYSQRTAYSQESRSSLRHSGHYLHPLEARVAQLERQNKMLQAALLAALDIGVSYDAECVRSGLPSPLSSYSTRLGSSLGGLGFDETRYERERTNRKSYPTRRPDSWASVRDQHSRGSQGSFETHSSESDASVRAMENMLSDLDVSEASGEWNEEWNCHTRRS